MQNSEKIKLIKGPDNSWENISFQSPMSYLCKKYEIDIRDSFEKKDCKISLTYRSCDAPKENGYFSGLFVDDQPSIIYDKKQIENLKTHDFFVVTNKKIGEYILKNICQKPVIFTQGVGAKDYYLDNGNLKGRSFSNKKKSAIICGPAYSKRIDIKQYVCEEWDLLYYDTEDRKIPNTIFKPITNIQTFHKELSEFSPDVIIQPWLNDEAYYYKGKMKFEESVTLNSCLLAEGPAALVYEVVDNVNGYKWDDIKDLKRILQETDIGNFRRIGMSHINDDREVLLNLYDDINEAYMQYCKFYKRFLNL